MWFYIFMAIIIVCAFLIYIIMKKQILELMNENSKLKYNYEERILDILYDAKRIENKFATSGTEMCQYLDNKIAEHSRKYYKIKNELDIDSNA